MKNAIKTLKHELRLVKERERWDRCIYKGEEKCSEAKKSFRINANRIAEYKEAIEVLQICRISNRK